jgi:hypothetical protein
MFNFFLETLNPRIMPIHMKNIFMYLEFSDEIYLKSSFVKSIVGVYF